MTRRRCAAPTRPRMIRMCNCPHCNEQTPLHPKSPGIELRMTVCAFCYLVFENSTVSSWLDDR